MRFNPLSTAAGRELDPRAGDASAVIHVPTSASFYEAAIEGLTRLNQEMLPLGDFPPIYESGVVYRKEKQDTWRHADDVLCSGWGDCEDLAAWRAAELRLSGEDPDARVYVYRSGPHRFHAVISRGDGTIEDPSLVLGMKVSAERRAKMPRYEGDTEMQDRQPRQFATCQTLGECSGCGACSEGESEGDIEEFEGEFEGDDGGHGYGASGIDDGHGYGASGIDESVGHAHPRFPGHHRVGIDESIGDPDTPLLGSLWSRMRSIARPRFPGLPGGSSLPFSYARHVMPPQMTYGDLDEGAGQDEDQPDDQDQQDDQDQDQEEAPAQPRRKKRSRKGGGGGGPRLVRAVEWGGNLATKAAVLPLKGLSKISRFLLGAIDDPEYVEGDEDVFTSPQTIEDVEASPVSQRLRMDNQQISPGVWQGTVTIPTQEGRAIQMKTSAAPNEAQAAERMLNLTKAAASTPALQAVVSPQALIAMAMMKGGPGTKLGQQLKTAGQTAGKFIKFAGY